MIFFYQSNINLPHLNLKPFDFRWW